MGRGKKKVITFSGWCLSVPLCTLLISSLVFGVDVWERVYVSEIYGGREMERREGEQGWM